MRLSRPSSTIWRASIWPTMFTRTPWMPVSSEMTDSLSSFCSAMNLARSPATSAILSSSSVSLAARIVASSTIWPASFVSTALSSSIAALRPVISPVMAAIWPSAHTLRAVTSSLSALLALMSAIASLILAIASSIELRRDLTTPSSDSRPLT